MNDDQLNLLWIGAFRYYCGRMTCAVSSFCATLVAQWPNIPEHAQSIIRRDLLEEFERDDEARAEGSTYRPLGHDCDRDEWQKVRVAIAQSKQREG